MYSFIPLLTPWDRWFCTVPLSYPLSVVLGSLIFADELFQSKVWSVASVRAAPHLESTLVHPVSSTRQCNCLILRYIMRLLKNTQAGDEEG